LDRSFFKVPVSRRVQARKKPYGRGNNAKQEYNPGNRGDSE
jgi:hypothetical protein